MSHKTNPISNRLPLNKNWSSKWFSASGTAYNIIEDAEIRRLLASHYSKEASIGLVEIERNSKEIKIVLHTSKPGVVIGRSGAGINEAKSLLDRKIQSFRHRVFASYSSPNANASDLPKNIKIEIVEIKSPELNAQVVAQQIALQIEKRASYRRLIKQAIERTMQRGAKGIKIRIAGRLNGAEIARKEKFSEGTVPLQTFRNDISYAHADAKTTAHGTIGIKVWIYRGDKLLDALNPSNKKTINQK